MADSYRSGKRALIFAAVIALIIISAGTAVFVARRTARAATLSAGDLVKASFPAVYYYGGDGKRYVFPNEKTYGTWYSDFSSVKKITDAELAAIAIGGNVTYRPGVRMVKITSDPKVYAVAKGGVLRWVTSETIAVALYGSGWNQMIDDVSDAFFTNYTVGSDIGSASDYSPSAETAGSSSINTDKNLSGAAPAVPVSSPSAATGPVRIFFTDLLSGPNSGGENSAGAFVTVRGKNFGVSRGSSTVTVGGGSVAAYRSWSDTKIVVQIGGAARTGNVVVQTSEGASNGVPFTVRSGNIYFVSTSGNDQNAGSFSAPWRTIVKAKDSIGAGDIAYIRDGVAQTAEDNFTAALSVESSGGNGAPRALAAYPGATATVGSSALEFGIRVPNIGIAASDWVFSGLVLRGGVQAMDIGGSGSSRWRIVGNDISCPVGDGQTGCFAAALASNIVFLGNEVHGISKQGSQPSKQYHAVYFTTDTNHVEVGWNHIHDNNTCRAIQFHSSPLDGGTGYNQYDLSVHDNLIHGDVCDGINFATVDPSKGAVRAYNNVIYDVGRGPDPPDGSANYACIYVAGGTNTGSDGAGNVEIYNNTLYDCGANGGSDSGAFSRGDGSPNLFMNLRNNVVYARSGESYIAESSNTSGVRGSNNLWFGGGAAPNVTTGNITTDPRFVNAAAADFRLQSGSPAIDAGVGGLAAGDYDGVTRPQGGGADIGAFEFSP